MSVNPEDWILTSSSKFLPNLSEKRFKNWVVIDRRRRFSQEIKNFTAGQKPQNAVKKTTRLAEIRDVLRRNWTNGSFDKTKEPAPDLDKLFFSIALWLVRFVLMGRTWWEKTWSVIFRRTSSAEKSCVWLVKVGGVRGRLMLAQTVLLYMNWLHIYIYTYIFQLNLCPFFTSDKEAFCPALNSSLASANASLLACEIECCFGNNCNNLNFPGRYMTWAHHPKCEGG